MFNSNLHQTIVPCSYRAVWLLCNVFYSDAAYLLAIDRDRLLVNRYLFHCYHLQTPSDDALNGHIEFDPYDSHRCIYVAPKMKRENKKKKKIRKITLALLISKALSHTYVKNCKTNRISREQITTTTTNH